MTHRQYLERQKKLAILEAPTSAPAWDRTGAALARSKALNHYHVVAAYYRQVQCAGSSTQYQNKQGIIKIFLYNNAKTIIVRLNDWIHAIVLGSGSVFFNHWIISIVHPITPKKHKLLLYIFFNIESCQQKQIYWLSIKKISFLASFQHFNNKNLRICMEMTRSMFTDPGQ